MWANGLNQDFRFGHPGADSIGKPRPRSNVLRTAFTFEPPFFAGPAFRSGLIKAFRSASGPSADTAPTLPLGNFPVPAALRSAR